MIAEVRDPSQVAGARRIAQDMAQRVGFDETDAGRVALVATEMATNLVKHGGGGILIADLFDDVDGTGVELMALDKGPGMADFQRCATDGYSTAGSPGNGLGAIARQSSRLGVFSRTGQGTVLMARCAAKSSAPPRTKAEIGAISVPYPGETECGDGWSFQPGDTNDTLLVADGSGHGALAALASRRAIATFDENARQDLSRLAASLHRALGPTRGAAIAIARVDRGAGLVRYVGIGNIVGAVISNGELRRMVSHNGTAGHIVPRISEFTYPFQGRPLVILHSDGLGTRWDLTAYPGLAQLHPSVIAGVLYRDHRRERDDASIVVMRAAA